MKCEKCLTETVSGANYRFYYGNVKSVSTAQGTYVDAITGKIKSGIIETTQYYITGSQVVFLCDECVAQKAATFAFNQALFYPIGALILGILVTGAFSFLGLGLDSLITTLIIILAAPLLVLLSVSRPMFSQVSRIRRAIEQHDHAFLRSVVESNRAHQYSLGAISDFGDSLAITLQSAELAKEGYYSTYLTRTEYGRLKTNDS